jgi:hypothetical protein
MMGSAMLREARSSQDRKVEHISEFSTCPSFVIETPEFMSEVVKTEECSKVLSISAQMVMEEARAKQAASMTELPWQGRRLPVRNEKTRVCILRGKAAAAGEGRQHLLDSGTVWMHGLSKALGSGVQLFASLQMRE